MFPKIIWQTHELPYKKLPDFQKNIIETWKYLNPDWEHRYIDAEERSKQVKEYDSLLHSYYLLLGKVHQADIWRLVTLYEYGGVYADMDSVCIKPIEEAIEWNYKGEQMMCSSIGFQNGGVNNSNFGSIKNSKIVKLILDTYILTYESYDAETFKSLEHGEPENVLFSKIVQENKKLVYFNNEYFSHSEEYKTSFPNNWINFKN
jgi:mannosyltransferase OCH1-like enzyme